MPRKVMEEMEKYFSVWMQDQYQRPAQLIQKKAKSLYEDVKKKHSKESRVYLLIPAMAGFIGSKLEPTFTT